MREFLKDIKVLIVIGVAGTGKTTIGRLLANRLSWEFKDADEFHSDANVRKMQHGTPLSDEDRMPWLKKLQRFVQNRTKNNKRTVLAFSGLKRLHRELVTQNNNNVELIYLKGDQELIRSRIKARPNHFFDPDLLSTQFDIFEEPSEAEAIQVDINDTPKKIVDRIMKHLHT